jgi:hypothetical protein
MKLLCNSISLEALGASLLLMPGQVDRGLHFRVIPTAAGADDRKSWTFKPDYSRVLGDYSKLGDKRRNRFVVREKVETHLPALCPLGCDPIIGWR